jgi:RNA polymerase sigma factor (sigma-70 family)
MAAYASAVSPRLEAAAAPPSETPPSERPPRPASLAAGAALRTAATPASPSGRLGDLFDALHQRLYRLACRMVGDAEEARDLVQETFLRAARRPGSLPELDEAAEAWLFRVLVNLCRDQYRRRAVRARAELLERGAPAARPVAADPESSAVARDLVAALLGCLPPRRRAVVTLFEMEGLSVRRIAALLRLREVTVRWHLARGRRQMASLLLAGQPEGRIGS